MHRGPVFVRSTIHPFSEKSLTAIVSKEFQIGLYWVVQPFSQKSRTSTDAKEFQIGLCGVVEADWELLCNCWSAGFLGERL